MWITERKNSKGTRYVYQERFTDERTGKRITLSVTLNSNSRHAQRTAADMLRDKFQEKERNTVKDERAERLAALTLATVCNEWLDFTNKEGKDMTRRNRRQYVRKILDEVGPDILFADFTPAVAENAIRTMYLDDLLSKWYTNSVRVAMKSIMKYAKKAGYIQDVTDYLAIKLPHRPSTKQELEKRSNKFLDKDELRSCLDQLARINYRVSLAMEFISLTGLRIGELLALRRKDVELDKKLLHVTGTLVNIRCNGDEYQRGTPKNDFSYRDVTLSRRAVQILEWFYTDNKRQEVWGHQKNSLCSKYKDRGYIFTTSTGQPYNMQFINHLLKKVDIPGKTLTTHIFRHTHISMLAAMGVPVKAIMARVGHNDPKTTLSVYTHITQDMQEKLDRCLDKMTV